MQFSRFFLEPKKRKNRCSRRLRIVVLTLTSCEVVSAGELLASDTCHERGHDLFICM